MKIERLTERDWIDVKVTPPPRDGTFILLTWMEDGEPQEVFPMRWEPNAENGLYPGVRGFWVVPGGSLTWSEVDPEACPTHWAHDPELAKFGQPSVRLVWSRT